MAVTAPASSQQGTVARHRRRAAGQTRLRLLRAFEICHGDNAISLPFAAERVVAFLAIHHVPVRRSYVAGSLWFDVDEARANASLRSALWRSRRHGIPIVEARDGCISLGADVSVDMRELRDLARRILRADDPSTREEIDALAIAGDLLPGWYEDWVLVEREHLRDLRMRALERACEALTSKGRFADAAEAGLAAVACEPLRESAHRALVNLHLVEGNVAEAARQYNLFARMLLSALECEPSERMNDLVRGLRLR